MIKKGDTVYLIYQQKVGKISFINNSEICVKYHINGNIYNLWTDTKGKLPNSELTLFETPKYERNDTVIFTDIDGSKCFAIIEEAIITSSEIKYNIVFPRITSYYELKGKKCTVPESMLTKANF